MGGIENYLVRLPDYLPSDIQLFYFLAQERGALAHEAERKGVQILPVPSPPPKWMPEYIYFLLPLARAIKVVKPDIIHAHFENLYVIAMIARFLARSKAAFIAHRHSRPYLAKRSFLWKLHKLLLPRAELILCVSDFVRQANIDFYHLPPEKTRVHYPGLPLEPFQELPEKESS
ncbi:MAG: glycosyltransferase family 4 protein, partial [Nitrososphaerota archaeon]